MSGFSIVIISISFIARYAFSVELYENDSRITILNEDNFMDFVRLQPTLVQFYLRYCGSCQEYALKFRNLSKSVESMQPVPYTFGGEPFPFEKYFSESMFREKLSETLVNEKQNDRLVPKVNISNSVTVFGPDINQVAMLILDTQLNVPMKLQSAVLEGDQYGVKDLSGKTVFSSEDVEAVRQFLAESYQKGEEKPLKPVKEPVFNDSKSLVNPIPYSMPVYAADIIASLQYLFKHDVALKKEIKGDNLEALKEFLTVLSKLGKLFLNSSSEREKERNRCL
ncbi:hypothetical protein Aperf_G00000095948 [Anoplocephala perfoliata]